MVGPPARVGWTVGWPITWTMPWMTTRIFQLNTGSGEPQPQPMMGRNPQGPEHDTLRPLVKGSGKTSQEAEEICRENSTCNPWKSGKGNKCPPLLSPCSLSGLHSLSAASGRAPHSPTGHDSGPLLELEGSSWEDEDSTRLRWS